MQEEQQDYSLPPPQGEQDHDAVDSILLPHLPPTVTSPSSPQGNSPPFITDAVTAPSSPPSQDSATVATTTRNDIDVRAQAQHEAMLDTLAQVDDALDETDMPILDDNNNVPPTTANQEQQHPLIPAPTVSPNMTAALPNVSLAPRVVAPPHHVIPRGPKRRIINPGTVVVQSVSEQHHTKEALKCIICGKGPQDDGRILCRFLPHSKNIMDANPPLTPTMSQDILIHVFCGKTASILPNVNRPDLEILTKAGIKNKHGIGPEVNGALARTRSSTLATPALGTGGETREKTFYLVKEFEAHLDMIRRHMTFVNGGNNNNNNDTIQEPTTTHGLHNYDSATTTTLVHSPYITTPPPTNIMMAAPPPPRHYVRDPSSSSKSKTRQRQDSLPNNNRVYPSSPRSPTSKVVPHRASIPTFDKTQAWH